MHISGETERGDMHLTLPHVRFFRNSLSFRKRRQFYSKRVLQRLSMTTKNEEGGPSASPTPAPQQDGYEKLRAAWDLIALECTDYSTIVSEIHPAKVMDDASCFTRGPHLSITHMGYFKPPNDAFITELRDKDHRSVKE